MPDFEHFSVANWKKFIGELHPDEFKVPDYVNGCDDEPEPTGVYESETFTIERYPTFYLVYPDNDDHNCVVIK